MLSWSWRSINCYCCIKLVLLYYFTYIDDARSNTNLFYVFISILYMFRATSCSSSGESFVSIQHLVYVTLCRWPFRVQVGTDVSDLHTKRSPTQSDIYQMLYWHNWFSWWWARGCSKHVEYWNKHIESYYVSIWSFTKSLMWLSHNSPRGTDYHYLYRHSVRPVSLLGIQPITCSPWPALTTVCRCLVQIRSVRRYKTTESKVVVVGSTGLTTCGVNFMVTPCIK